MIDWGLGAAWLSAIGTVGALWFIALTTRRDAEREQKAQASMVGIWVEGATYDRNANPPKWSRFEVVVNNGSDAPIHDVRVDRLPIDWNKTSKYVEAASVSVVLPHKETPWMPFEGFEGAVSEFYGIPDAPPLRLHFKDNAGVRWVRYPNGALHELRKRWWNRKWPEV